MQRIPTTTFLIPMSLGYILLFTTSAAVVLDVDKPRELGVAQKFSLAPGSAPDWLRGAQYVKQDEKLRISPSEGDNVHPNAREAGSWEEWVKVMQPKHIVDCKLNATENATESCSFANMSEGVHYMVYPGGQTSCVDTDHADYAFQVVPGSTNKLMIYFDGGGACWDAFTKGVGACYKSKVQAVPHTGILTRGTYNIFSDYTKIIMTQCSGDLHVGDTEYIFWTERGIPVKQKGYQNVRAAIDWIKTNLNTNGEFDNVVLAGESAGAIAVQLWSDALLRELKYKEAEVIIDSYIGVFPHGFESRIMQQYNKCSSQILIDPVLQKQCHTGSLTLPAVLDHTMKAWPQITFSQINSQYDYIQREFYSLANMAIGNIFDPEISNDDFAESVITITDNYAYHHNYKLYMAGAHQHVFITTLFDTFPGYDNRYQHGAKGKYAMEKWLAGICQEKMIILSGSAKLRAHSQSAALSLTHLLYPILFIVWTLNMIN